MQPIKSYLLTTPLVPQFEKGHTFMLEGRTFEVHDVLMRDAAGIADFYEVRKYGEIRTRILRIDRATGQQYMRFPEFPS